MDKHVWITGVKAFGRTGDESDFVLFDAKDIFKVVLDKPTKSAPKQPLYYTKHGAYWVIGTLEGLEITLEPFGITALDNVNLVNLHNVKYIQETAFYVRAYFEDGSFATVSRRNLWKIEHIPRGPNV